MSNLTQDQQSQIASTILNQLGGRRFAAMTGVKEITMLPEGGVRFKIGRNCNRVNTVTITLDHGADTYDMKFEKVSFIKKTASFKRKLIDSFEGVYFDMLQSLFTDATGMDTHL